MPRALIAFIKPNHGQNNVAFYLWEINVQHQQIELGVDHRIESRLAVTYFGDNKVFQLCEHMPKSKTDIVIVINLDRGITWSRFNSRRWNLLPQY